MAKIYTFEEKKNIFIKKLNERYRDVYPDNNFKIADGYDFIDNDEFIYISFNINDKEYKWKTKPRYMNGRRLPLELRNHLKKINGIKNNPVSHEIFEERFYNIYSKDEYELVGKYTKMSNKIKTKHIKCGKTEENYATNLIHGNMTRGCNFCYGKRKRTIDEYQELFNINNLKDYKINSINDTYKKGHIYGNITHISSVCENYNFDIRMTDMISSHKQRCPKCAQINVESKAFRDIKQFLIDNNIKFETEVIIDGLVYINNLRIDLYLPEYELYIEYDGIQHFKNTFNISDDLYEKVKIRDNIKDNFFNEKNMNFERINYKEDHMNKIRDILNKYNAQVKSD